MSGNYRPRTPAEMESMAANDETLGPESNAGSQTIVPVPDPAGNQQVLGNQSRNYGSSAANLQNPVYPTSPGNQQNTGIHQGTGNLQGNQQSPSNRADAQKKTKHLKREKSFYTPNMEDKLCRKLKFHFMGPHEKILARRKCPWKLLIQVVKVVLITVQLIQFGYNRSSFVEFTEKTTLAMKHLYLQDWTNAYETMPYPAAIGKYAVYMTDTLRNYVDYAMQQYDATEEIAVASLKFYKNATSHEMMTLCLEHYKSGEIDTVNNTYDIDSTVTNACYTVGRLSNGTYSIVDYLKEKYNVSFHFDRLLALTLKFRLKSFRLDMNERKFPPQLYSVNVKILYDNRNKDGQMLVKLTTDLREQDISGHTSDEDADAEKRVGLMVFDGFVLLVTALSILLCSRAVVRAQSLKRTTMKFFKRRYGKDLSWSDRFEFVNLWYVTIIINDILTLVGTGYKIQLESRNLKSSSSNYDICTVMLGTGSLLAWLGVLRYIGFFQQFNILIVTLKKAFPNMLRFLVCCMLLYIGFVICGWVVLGPYHIKFRQMSTASECLFSLINGDDMFVTFSATVTDSNLIWYYSRIYLYGFISLFIYAVLNLFIAVIMDTYETIKEYYEKGFPKTELFEFIDQCQDPAHSPIYRREDTSCNPITALCCCCRANPDEPDEFTALIQ